MNAQFIDLNNKEQLEELFEVSKSKPVLFFKHSISCPISANVLEEVANVDSTIFLIVVQDSRELSNLIAEKTGIRHESPQAIIIKNEKPVYHASHYDIDTEDLASQLASSSIS